MRYKEFNNNKVLEDCISLFWQNSFNGTPISTVVDKTNVNRYSLYHEFENKQGILYAALRLYKERYADKLLVLLDGKSEVDKTLKHFFESFLSNDKRPPGCFIIYIATELGDNDPHINAYLKAYLKEVEELFMAILKSNKGYQENARAITDNLTLLFCNVMCHCHIQEEQESKDLITLNLELILNQHHG